MLHSQVLAWSPCFSSLSLLSAEITGKHHHVCFGIGSCYEWIPGLKGQSVRTHGKNVRCTEAPGFLMLGQGPTVLVSFVWEGVLRGWGPYFLPQLFLKVIQNKRKAPVGKVHLLSFYWTSGSWRYGLDPWSPLILLFPTKGILETSGGRALQVPNTVGT